jgi:hypothetical protein
MVSELPKQSQEDSETGNVVNANEQYPITQLELRKTELSSRIRNLRRLFTIALVLVILLGVAFTTGNISSYRCCPEYHIDIIQSSIFGGVLAVTGLYILYFFLSNRYTDEIVEIETRQRIQLQLQNSSSHKSPETSYFERLVNINIENLAEYYFLVKIHTRNSFRASLYAGVLGFMFVMFRNVSRICNNSSKKIKEDLARRVG